jgi:hypothetical protein
VTIKRRLLGDPRHFDAFNSSGKYNHRQHRPLKDILADFVHATPASGLFNPFSPAE